MKLQYLKFGHQERVPAAIQINDPENAPTNSNTTLIEGIDIAVISVIETRINVTTTTNLLR